MSKLTLNLRIFNSYGTLLALIILVTIFSILRPYSFCSLGNFINITRQISLLVIISMGATMVMSINEFDLSIGSMASLGGIMSTIMAANGFPIILCFAFPLLICSAIGMINGLIVAKFGVLSFVTTLGMSTIITGIIFRLTGGSTVFQNIPKSFSYMGTAKLLGVPILSILMLVGILVFYFMMERMVIGRKLYAIGGNEAASKISGINVKKYKIIAFSLCATMAGFTGILIASRLGSANVTAGDGYFLQTYAAVFIGCTVSKCGVPNIQGTVIGAAILGILANGLTILQMPTYMQNLITGAIIIVAVILQKLDRNNR